MRSTAPTSSWPRCGRTVLHHAAPGVIDMADAGLSNLERHTRRLWRRVHDNVFNECIAIINTNSYPLQSATLDLTRVLLSDPASTFLTSMLRDIQLQCSARMRPIRSLAILSVAAMKGASRRRFLVRPVYNFQAHQNHLGAVGDIGS